MKYFMIKKISLMQHFLKMYNIITFLWFGNQLALKVGLLFMKNTYAYVLFNNSLLVSLL